MRKNYAIYTSNLECIVCKTPLVGVDKFGRTTRNIPDSIYPLDYLKCPNCDREYLACWDTEKKTLVARSYCNIDTFISNLINKLQNS